MVVVFFGTPAFAVPSLAALVASRHHVAAVVTQPDRPRGRGQKVSVSPVKALALDHQIPVLQPDRLRDPAVAEALRAFAPDIGVVAAYGKIIPDALLSLPRRGMINVHASVLPRYRGAAPIHRAVMHGEAETGVTIMRVVRELDAGPMFSVVTRPIGSDETSDVVEADLARLGADLLLRTMDDIDAGTAVETPQDATQATYAARIVREDGLITWSRDARDIHNQVRGLYPWPHAFTFLDGQRIIVRRTTLAPAVATSGAAPGTVVAVSREGLTVATGGDGAVTIVELQPEGRRPMAVREFLAGRPVAPGVTFHTA
jgi:methionyl-tRNA formyltransferase